MREAGEDGDTTGKPLGNPGDGEHPLEDLEQKLADHGTEQAETAAVLKAQRDAIKALAKLVRSRQAAALAARA